jgi:acetyl-CoA synthetase
MSGMSNPNLDDLLREDRRFPPPPEFAAAAHVRDRSAWPKGEEARLAYWAERARELEWDVPFTKVLEWDPPFAKWFDDGKLNASVNCLDRHLSTWRANKAAIVFEGEPGDRRTLTYRQLHGDVCRFANVLRDLGVAEGDRVAIYMPLVPEAVVAMLACARIGAVHTVVFGGFSAKSVAERILDAEAQVVVTADGGWRRGADQPLKEAVDEAVSIAAGSGHLVRHVVVLRRTGRECPMHAGRDVWWDDVMRDAPAQCEAASLPAEHPLYILYTSGTTGKPKGILHTTGGYMTGVTATSRQVFDLRDEDVYWCTADIGWVTGHSYVVYGPLANGATVMLYEGAPDWPHRDRLWSMVERHGVTIFYTAPTAIRAFMRWGEEHPHRHDLSSLRLLGSVGEPINPEAWMWYQRVIGRGNCPIVDTWWQTETGMIMISPLPGVTTTKPGSATHAVPGVEASVVDANGKTVAKGGGILVITKPWPSMLRTLWRDPERYRQVYWSRFGPEVYFPGDGAKVDEDGCFWLLGRIDDVLNPSGHRIGTAEVESALVSHPRVAEAAVVGRPHEIKGDAIAAFVVLRGGLPDGGIEDTLADELREHVSREIGKIARPDDVHFVADVPKTRSGKIMRRLLRDIASGKALGDTTTLADPAVVEDLKTRYASSEEG